MTFVPDAEEITKINETDGGAISAVLAFTGIDVDVGTAFLSLLDVDASDYYALCGDITRTELEDILSRTRLAGDTKLTFGQKAKIRMAFRVARAMAGIA